MLRILLACCFDKLKACVDYSDNYSWTRLSERYRVDKLFYDTIAVSTIIMVTPNYPHYYLSAKFQTFSTHNKNTHNNIT